MSSIRVLHRALARSRTRCARGSTIIPLVNNSACGCQSHFQTPLQLRTFSDARRPPPPPPPSPPVPAVADPWEAVPDPAGSGKVYWWNTATDEVTAVGAPRPAPPPTATDAAAPPAAAPAAGGGLGRVMAEGMAFGVGSSMAHRAVSFRFSKSLYHLYVFFPRKEMHTIINKKYLMKDKFSECFKDSVIDMLNYIYRVVNSDTTQLLCQVDGVMGPRTVEHVHTNPDDAAQSDGGGAGGAPPQDDYDSQQDDNPAGDGGGGWFTDDDDGGGGGGGWFGGDDDGEGWF